MSCFTGIGIAAPPSDQLTIQCPNRDTVTTTLLHHIRHIVPEENVTRTDNIVPLAQVVAVYIENLDPVVLSVANVNVVVLVYTDLVQNRELSRLSPGLTP